MTKKEEIAEKIETLKGEKKRMLKELENPFLNIHLRKQYKRDLIKTQRSIEALQMKLFVMDVNVDGLTEQS